MRDFPDPFGFGVTIHHVSLCLPFGFGLGVGPACEPMPGFADQRLDSSGPHLLHRLHSWHLRVPSDSPHIPRPHPVPQPEEGGLCHRSTSCFRKGQVGHKLKNHCCCEVRSKSSDLLRLSGKPSQLLPDAGDNCDGCKLQGRRRGVQ